MFQFKINPRKIHTIEDAEKFIHEFMVETLNHPQEGSYGKSFDFDLFLPWLMDWVLNTPHDKNEEGTPTSDLEVLYMDAGWSLCQQGVLRPGPRSTGGEGVGGAYGKGYSLTPKGRQWLMTVQDEPLESARQPQDVPATNLH